MKRSRSLAWVALLAFSAVFCVLGFAARASSEPLRVATFEFDVTPPLGSPLCEGAVDKAARIDDPLKCRGIILLSDEKPVVLCGVDWVGISGNGHVAWRKALADAAGTTPDRVAVQCLHQHDAPGFDPDAEALMAERNQPGRGYPLGFDQIVIGRAKSAIQAALAQPKPVTHIGVGKAEVKHVASNRRVLGADGMVRYIRWSATREVEARAAPEGIIDPFVRAVSLWNGERPVAVLSYYATHPQSHYGKGGVSCDFVGIARRMRDEAAPGTFFVHFDGASGNVTAGKYNDGAPANRMVLAGRLADGMAAAQADAAGHRVAIGPADVHWRSVAVALPVAPWLDETKVGSEFAAHPNFARASDLAWARRRREGQTIDLNVLELGGARILHMPGELFVEYQLFAQRLRPDLFVAMAAYGNYSPGYIGTRVAYPQGGYETGQASRVAPEVEDVLVAALRDLLDAKDRRTESPSEITATAPRVEGSAKP